MAERLLAIVGFGAIVTVICNVDAVQHWLVNPKLEAKVVLFTIREGNAYSATGRVFDEVSAKVNVTPHVQFHIGSFPVNQVMSITVEKKGEEQLKSRIRVVPDLPITVKDEPVVITVMLPSVPIEWGSAWNDVEVHLTDRWGQISSVPLQSSQ